MVQPLQDWAAGAFPRNFVQLNSMDVWKVRFVVVGLLDNHIPHRGRPGSNQVFSLFEQPPEIFSALSALRHNGV